MRQRAPPPPTCAAALDCLRLDGGSTAPPTPTPLRCRYHASGPCSSACSAYKGYEEVRVPAVAPSQPPPGETSVEVASLPDWAQLAFQGYQRLNRIQVHVGGRMQQARRPR